MSGLARGFISLFRCYARVSNCLPIEGVKWVNMDGFPPVDAAIIAAIIALIGLLINGM